jgi:hypothetical protein
VLARRGLTVHLISGATGEGMEKLLDAVVYELDRAGPAAPLEKDLPGHGLPPEEDLEDVDPGEPGAGGEQAVSAVPVDEIETEEELEAAIAAEEAAKAAARAKTVFQPPLANEPLRLEDIEPPAPVKAKAVEAPLLEDERAESAQEKQKRAPKITGRRKDGMFKEKAAKSEQPLAGKFKPTSEAAQALLQSAARRGGGARAVVPAVRTLGPVVRGPKKKAAAAAPAAKATVKAVAKKAAGKKAAPKKPIGKLGASEAAQKRTLAKAQAQAAAAAEKKLGKASPTTRAAEAFKAKIAKSKAKAKNKKVLPPSKRRSAKSRRAPNQ